MSEARLEHDWMRYGERRAHYAEALSRLREVVVMPVSDVVRDSTIQRFEFTYELAWKTLKSYLQSEGVDARTPKTVLQEAFQLGLIANADGWSKALEWRNLMSHTYDLSRANGAYAFIREDMFALFEALLDRLPEAA